MIRHMAWSAVVYRYVEFPQIPTGLGIVAKVVLAAVARSKRRTRLSPKSAIKSDVLSPQIPWGYFKLLTRVDAALVVISTRRTALSRTVQRLRPSLHAPSAYSPRSASGRGSGGALDGRPANTLTSRVGT